jgi:pyruvate-formate lyase-activating enzyme
MGRKRHDREIDTSELFRMPWTQSDNAFSWIEPTRFCDLACEYCYQVHDPNTHKSVEEFEEELVGLLKLRKTDAIFIAGGEPLTHPKIVELVRIVKKHGVKPLLLSNGHKLTPKMVKRLKKAGLKGFVFHVDRYQNRPGWRNKSEKEINRLRQKLCDMVHKEGGMVCGYNTTIVPDTLSEIGDIVEWTLKNVDRVAFNVIIPVRMIHKDDPFDYYIGDQKIDLGQTFLCDKKKYRYISAQDLYDEILKVVPDYRFNAYLGGTVRANVPKWLFGTHIGSKDKVFGYLGPKSQELTQLSHHAVKGTYFSFLRVGLARRGKLTFFLSVLDKEVRHALGTYLKSTLKHPKNLFRRIGLQTIIVMQPQDVLPNGEQDRCDGCPNKTYWNGRLVSECRMEEYMQYGRLMTMVPKTDCGVKGST